MRGKFVVASRAPPASRGVERLHTSQAYAAWEAPQLLHSLAFCGGAVAVQQYIGWELRQATFHCGTLPERRLTAQILSRAVWQL